MEKSCNVSDKLIQRLLHEIREGRFAQRDALPPEIELAEQFGVSRNIIRECLTKLEREGWITRKHGVGTLINRSVAHVKTRLDLNFELCQTLELTGKKAEIAFVKCQEQPADEALARTLHIQTGQPVLRVSRMIRADGKPAVFCVDYFPKSLLIDSTYTQEQISHSIFTFLQQCCGVEVVTNLAEIRAMPVTEEVAQALEIPLTCSLLYLGEVGYDLRSNPILYSEEYFIDRMIPHMIVRKKI